MPVLLVGLMVLAGCAAKNLGGTETAQLDDFHVQATKSTGVIRGIVVDDAVRPLVNVDISVVVQGKSMHTNSTLRGSFGFQGLPEGTYFVKAHKLGYQDTQTTAIVTAGVSDPPLAKIQMVYIPGQAPFLNEFKINAFVECIVPGANVCAIANLYPCIFAGYCANTTSDTSFILLYGPVMAQKRTPDFLQTELVWDSTQPVSDGLSIRYSAHEPADGTGIDARQARASGRSPIIMPMNHNLTTAWEIGLKKGISYEVFGWTQALAPVGSAGFVLNQQITFYFDIFYGYTPPAGWQFSKDGAYLPPR